jgi:hypothetical protein
MNFLTIRDTSEVVEFAVWTKLPVVYRDLLNAFRPRFGGARKALGEVEQVKILRELRLNPKAS